MPATLIDYAGLPNHGARTLIEHAGRVRRAETEVRRLGRDRFEHLLIHREVTPFSAGGLAEKLAAGADHSVYDFDDALMWTEELASNRRVGPSRLARGLWSKAAACRRTVAAVDTVIAGNEVLAEWAAQYNSSIEVIPTCVDPSSYDAKRDYDIDEVPQLVWLGSPATEYNLDQIVEALLRVHQLTGARLTVISAGNGDLGPLNSMTDRVDWTLDEVRRLSRFDLALAPLTDSPYERGKSAYKLIQYGAAGLPAVVSPVAANRTVAAQLGQRTATGTEEWVDAVSDLLSADAAERSRIGAQASAAVKDRYSFQAWAETWLRTVAPMAAPA